MNQETLQGLLIEQIRDIYDAEKQLVKALPRLAKAAQSAGLASALNSHFKETQNQVSRLEEIFKMLKTAARGKPCKGMKGLIDEGAEVLKEEEKGSLRDLALIAGCQKVEHYEMSAYGTARTLAEQLGLDDAVELLQQTEDEEKQADENLTEAAVALYDVLDSEGDEQPAGATAARGSSAKPGVRKAGR